jgi:uncharacterized protein (TIGR02147 family)
LQSIFTYQNFRIFLKDFYSSKKCKDPAYSFKIFSEAAGIKSSNYLTLVMDGSRNLTTTNIQQFAIALKLRVDETEFFETLVLYNQSKTKIEQDFYKKRLLGLRKEKPSKIQKETPVGILKQWYSMGILVLAHGRTLEETRVKCKSELNARIEDIEYTIQKLIELGLLNLVDEKFQISSQQMTFSDAKSLSISQEMYLASQIEQSQKAFRMGYKKKKGKFLSHTLTVPRDSLDELQNNFVSFMENLTKKMDEKIVFGDEELLQINIQIFRPYF